MVVGGVGDERRLITLAVEPEQRPNRAYKLKWCPKLGTPCPKYSIESQRKKLSEKLKKNSPNFYNQLILTFLK
jgi:hypothetical protein